MKFAEWLELTGKRVQDIAYELGANHGTVFYWKKGAFKPSSKYMPRLKKLTKGKVTEKDFEEVS